MQLFNDMESEKELNNALAKLDNENRLIATPWSRIVRGLGLGQYPIDYNDKVTNWIHETFDELKKMTGSKNNYVNFSSLLCDFICLLIKKQRGLNESIKKNYVHNLLFTIDQEINPYRRVMQYCITIDALAKLNINLFDLLDGTVDLAALLFKSIDKIKPNNIKDENSGKHGDYEKLSAYTSAFFSFAVCGKADILISRENNYITDALNILDNIPSPYFRGRGGSMLFSAISLLGYAELLQENSRDYITETLDYLDSVGKDKVKPSFPQEMTPAFVKIYPLLTLLNAIAATGNHLLLNYRQDRIRQAKLLMEELSPVERTHMGLYYIMALYNLGLLEQEEQHVNDLVEQIGHTATSIDPAENYFLHGISCSYVIETAMITGKRHIISDKVVNSLIESFSAMNKTIDDEINRPYPFAYALTMLGDAGFAEKIFEPSAHYDNSSVAHWVINNLTLFDPDSCSNLYMLNHALINLMLRMRGTEFPTLKAYDDFQF
ncbi:hypothetical protein M1E08_04910 [Erwinia sp. PK3-005]